MRIEVIVMNYKSDFLNILEQRGFIHQCSDFNALDKKLCEGVQSAYIGFDATATSLHAGSLVQIMMLYWFQKCGHKPITLMGGGTTKIGDPSGKDESRKLLDDAQIEKNISGIARIFSKFLDYSKSENGALMINNADWLEKLNYIEFLRDYGPHFTINRMMTFESVKLRLDREQPLTFLEFNYMIMQAYDFVELHRRFGTILQMGGSDQWGNIINGVELGRRKDQAELFALTTPLLTTSSGAKMGKSADGAIWLNADMLSPYDYWQYWRNTEDADVERFLKLFTTLNLDAIQKAVTGDINEAKKLLANEATSLCHGIEEAEKAANTAQQVFEKGGVGDDLPFIEISQAELENGIPYIDVSCALNLVGSKGEARRLIKGGGARLNDKAVNSDSLLITKDDLTEEGYIKISAGKKKHALVRIK
jgi:tyrosyl-tRNA synthetase